MSWGFGNSAGLLQLSSFAEAKNKWQNTVPIRGRTVECRPLGRNRARSDYEIKKHWRVVEDGCLGKYIESYTARLWSKDFVEWFEDGKLSVKTGGYSSPSVNGLINYSIASNFGELYAHNGKPYFKTKDGKSYLLTQEGLLLEPTGEEVSQYGGVIAKVMQPLNPIQEYKYRANRKSLNAIRKKYKKFIDYGVAMYSIDDRIPERKDNNKGWYHYAFTYNKYQNNTVVQNRDRVFKMIDEFIDTDNLEIAYKAACEIGHGFAWSINCTPKQFADGMTELLKYRFKDEVFNIDKATIGEAFYDRNAKYFL